MVDPAVSIIIVHYKTKGLTTKCIESIYTSTFQDFEIIVVDNASNDGAGVEIKELYPHVKWIYNESNEGFGRANNLGILHAKGEYILLLNSDVQVNKDTLGTCLAEIEAIEDCGALGCKLLNPDGTIQKSQYFHVDDFHGVLKNNILFSHLMYKEPAILKAVMGAFMLIPSKIIQEVGDFDPDFFMYAEEMELCKRIVSAGYSINYTRKAFAFHEHGASSSNQTWSTRQNLLSNALLFYKTRGIVGYAVFHILMVLNMLTNICFIWKMTKPMKESFFLVNSCYLRNAPKYFILPFEYKRTRGEGNQLLKLDRK